MAGKLIHFVLETIDGQEDLAFLGGTLGKKLGAVSENGAAALLELGGDVDDKSGADVGVRDGVEDFEGPKGFAVERKLLEAGQEAAFVAQRRGVVMVGMARFPIGQNYGVRLEIADDLCQG